MSTVHPSEATFHETQHFRSVWFWGVILGVDALALVSVFALEQDKTEPTEWLVVVALLAAPLVLLWFFHLRTTVTNGALHIRFFPFHFKDVVFERSDLNGVEAVTYKPIRDVGGWGIRKGIGFTAYNVSGNRGIRFTTAGGKRMLIGSQRADELAAALTATSIGR